MSGKPKVLVMGATGQVGGALIPLLLRDERIEVIAAARNPDKAAKLGVPYVHLDLDDFSTFAPALEGIARIFMATGYTVDMLRQSKDLVNSAQRAGVQQIVHLGACGDDDTRVSHYGWHQFIERYIAGSGVMFTHLRPEIFMQNLLGYGGESYVNQGVIAHYVGGARLSWVDCDDVAAVAAECLTDPEHASGQHIGLGTKLRHITSLLRSYKGARTAVQLRAATSIGIPTERSCRRGRTCLHEVRLRQLYRSHNGVDIEADEVFDNFPTDHWSVSTHHS